MNRKKIAAGNWKMHKTLEEGQGLVQEIRTMAASELMNNATLMVFPPFTHLYTIARQLDGSGIMTGAQNMHEKEQGAFTGEISASMLKSVGIAHTLIGHSERRQYYNESNESCAAKIQTAVKHGITPVYCVGETLDEREQGSHFAVVLEQVLALNGLSSEQAAGIVLAYEPVWAIGTGRTATAEQANEMHLFIRRELAKLFGQETADNISILYGGSVKPDNAASLFAMSDIDGALIGGAALSSRDFIDIAKAL